VFNQYRDDSETETEFPVAVGAMHVAVDTALPSVTQQTNMLPMSLLIYLSASILLLLCARI
jgi:hypothetical protein